jgi:hypothetical protein
MGLFHADGEKKPDVTGNSGKKHMHLYREGADELLFPVKACFIFPKV